MFFPYSSGLLQGFGSAMSVSVLNSSSKITSEGVSSEGFRVKVFTVKIRNVEVLVYIVEVMKYLMRLCAH